MKKVITVFISLLMILSLAACGNSAGQTGQSSAEEEPEAGTVNREEPAENSTDADLDYNDNDSRTTIEMNDPDARPAISGSVEDMEQYDVVFIGYPKLVGINPYADCFFSGGI